MSISIPRRICRSFRPAADFLDLPGLLLEPAVTEAARVVADGEVGATEPLGRRDHLVEGRAAVRPGRVRVQVAADVVQLDELGQRPFARRLELAAVLAELGRDPAVAEELVELLLGRGREDFVRFRVLHAVLGDGKAARHRLFPHRDVVRLRAAEVLQEVSVALRRDDAQVEAKPVV